MLSRDWKCKGCGELFHSYDHGEPPCPFCGASAEWIPGGGHNLSDHTKGCDSTVRSLATSYGMTNMNTPSHSRVNRAMPHARGTFARSDPSLGVKHFAPGFSANFHPQLPTCAPSVVPPQIKGSRIVGQRLPRSESIGGPMISTKIEGRYYPNKA